jgi:hypothetical protein
MLCRLSWGALAQGTVQIYWTSLFTVRKNEITNNKTATPIQLEEKLGEEINQQPY